MQPISNPRVTDSRIVAGNPHATTFPYMRAIQARWMLVLLTAAACGAEVNQPATHCLTLSEPEGGAGLLTAAPSKVSLFFKVDTCDGAPV